MCSFQQKIVLLCSLAVVVCTAITSADTTEERIAALEKRVGGRLGVAALDTGSRKRFDYRANERFLMCSTFKFLAVAAILKRVDENKDDLNRFVRYGQNDILQYAPVTKQHLAEGGMKLGDLCAAAIEQSDNTAGNLLLQSIGGPAGLTAFARTLDDKMTRLDRTEPDLNIGTPGDERDTTTPAAMERDMSLLLTGKALSSASRERLDEWLSKNETGTGMIRAGVPKDWAIGDKTGRGSSNTNDIAIIRPPGKSPILLVIYSAGSSAPSEARDAVIAEVTRMVMDSL